MPRCNPSPYEAMARWLRPSEHCHRIAPQPGDDQIEALAIPPAGKPAGKPELTRGMRDVAITGAGKGYSLHSAKQLRDVAKVAPRPDDRRFHARDLDR